MWYENPIWQAVISSAVISTVLTNFCLWLHRRGDYKRDYYKKIIDKRLKAYEKLETFIGVLEVYTNVDKPPFFEEEVKIFYAFDNHKTCLDLLEQSIDILTYDLWYSDKIIKKLERINELMVDACEIIENDQDDDYREFKLNLDKWGEFSPEDILNWRTRREGAKIYDELDACIDSIAEEAVKDLQKLDEVESFFKKSNWKK